MPCSPEEHRLQKGRAEAGPAGNKSKTVSKGTPLQAGHPRRVSTVLASMGQGHLQCPDGLRLGPFIIHLPVDSRHIPAQAWLRWVPGSAQGVLSECQRQHPSGTEMGPGQGCGTPWVPIGGGMREALCANGWNPGGPTPMARSQPRSSGANLEKRLTAP